MNRLVTIAGRAVLAMCFGAVVFGVWAYLFPRQFLTIDSGEVKGDELVVLGGGDGRAERAAELFREGAAPGVLVTGHGDCQSNIETLEKNGVPANVIIAEPAALTTLENAEFSLPLLHKLGARRVILVTSWFHSRRALACFEHVAPDMRFYSRPSYLDFYPRAERLASYSEHVNFEYAKLVGYWFFHGVWPL